MLNSAHQHHYAPRCIRTFKVPNPISNQSINQHHSLCI